MEHHAPDYQAHAAETSAIPELHEDWLDMGEDVGLGRQALIAWSESHPLTVIVVAALAFWTPVVLALCFG